MKKVLGIVILTFLIFSNNVNAQRWGEGELQLTRNSAEQFIKFIRGKGNKKPADFYVTLDGTDVSYWTCSYAQCVEGDPIQDIYHCERQTGKKCKKFAWKRTVKWKNGINPAKGKASTFNSKWSDAEMYAKLTELGFYNNNSSKKSENNTNDSELVSKIKELKDLLDSGVITQDEFDKAKKKLLN